MSLEEHRDALAARTEPPTRGLWEVLVLGALGGVRGGERGEFGEALRRALNRPVLPHQAWRLWISAALLALLATLVVTGCLLSVQFVPTAGGAFSSVQAIDQLGFGNWFTRQMHVWSGRLAVLVAGLGVLRMLISADYKHRGLAKWVTANLLVLVLCMFFATGASLPSSAFANDSTRVLASTLAEFPLIGGVLRAWLVEPEHDPQAVLTRAFVQHVVLLPWVMFFLVVIVHSTRTRPRFVPSPAPGFAGGAPLWPHRAIETAVSVVLALGTAATCSLILPVQLGGPPRPDAVGPGVDPVFRPLTGIAAVFHEAGSGSRFAVSAALGAFCIGATGFLLLAFLDRGGERDPRRRKFVVMAGLAWFLICVALAFLGSPRP